MMRWCRDAMILWRRDAMVMAAVHLLREGDARLLGRCLPCARQCDVAWEVHRLAAFFNRLQEQAARARPMLPPGVPGARFRVSRCEHLAGRLRATMPAAVRAAVRVPHPRDSSGSRASSHIISTSMVRRFPVSSRATCLEPSPTETSRRMVITDQIRDVFGGICRIVDRQSDSVRHCQ